MRVHEYGIAGIKSKELCAIETTWEQIIDTYFKQQDHLAENGQMRTTSDFYVDLVKRSSELLDKLFNENGSRRLVRYQITGMLPEEFFNGPQIEYVLSDSTPIFFGHKWEQDGYGNSFYSMEDQKKKYLIKRCVLVRKEEISYGNGNDLSSLSTERDLVEQSKLELHTTQAIEMNKVGRYPGSARRLLAHADHRVREWSAHRVGGHTGSLPYEDFIQANLINSGAYRFYPISASEGPSTKKLTADYARFFHTRSSDAKYFCIDENSADMIGGINSKKSYFEKDRTPELAIFGFVDPDNEDDLPETWQFGIRGKYRPYSRDIDIQILPSSEATNLASEFASIMTCARPIQDL
jgi:hypothetical protein